MLGIVWFFNCVQEAWRGVLVSSQCGPHLWLGISDQSPGLGERVRIVIPLETLCRLYREPQRQRYIVIAFISKNENNW